jgi:hypothetical protein
MKLDSMSQTHLLPILEKLSKHQEAHDQSLEDHFFE